jgi:hypothetical protein
MKGLSLDKEKGSKSVSRQELDLITIPPETETWKPVGHYHLAELILTVSADVLTDYALIGENYGIARQGNQLFAILNFKADSSEMAMSIAFRNSYDKSMAFGMAFGASVFVCDNLCLTGDVVVMKKHSKTILDTLEDLVIANIFRARRNYEKVLIDSERLKNRPLANEQAFAIMGNLFGNGIVSPRQLTVLRDEWLKPTHQDFQPRNSWSLMNATTQALKTTPPYLAIERNTRAYNTIIDVWGGP